MIFKEFKEFLELKKHGTQLFDMDKLYMGELNHYNISKNLISSNNGLNRYSIELKRKPIRNVVVVASSSNEKDNYINNFSLGVRYWLKNMDCYKTITMGDRIIPFISMSSALDQTEFSGDMYALGRVVPFRNLIKAHKIQLSDNVKIEIPSVITLDDIREAETYLNQNAPTLDLE